MTTTYDENGSPTGTSWTAYFFGGAYEVRSDSTTIKYYSFAGQTIMNDGDGLKYFLTDHLGSVVAITDEDGELLEQQRYLPFGGVRTIPNSLITNTDYGYTGQRNLDNDIGLMDYRARFYSPVLNRFVQPDSIIPETYNPQTWNRYSYVNNRPIIFNDPSGHCVWDLCLVEGTAATFGILVVVAVVATILTYAVDVVVSSVVNSMDERWKVRNTNPKNRQSLIDSSQKIGYENFTPGYKKNPKDQKCGVWCFLKIAGGLVVAGAVACVEIWSYQCEKALSRPSPTSTSTPTPTNTSTSNPMITPPSGYYIRPIYTPY